jgi:hypothetical protein
MISAWDILREYVAIGTFGRPDASGIRMNGANKQNTARPGEWPYDDTDQGLDQMYGNPAAYGRSGPSSPASLHHPIVPKDVKHTAWDPEREDEAMGTPTNFGMSGQGQGGSTVPGTVGHGWNDRPMKPWDDDDDEKRDAVLKAREDEGMGAWGMHPGVHEVMPPEKTPNGGDPDDEPDIDRNTLQALARDYGLADPDEHQGGSMPPSAMARVAGSPFSGGPMSKKYANSRTSDWSQPE